jgi:hypothetical protein
MAISDLQIVDLQEHFDHPAGCLRCAHAGWALKPTAPEPQ